MQLPQFVLLSFFFFFSNCIQAQRITPSTQNIGGGYASNIEWSIGESISIDYFSTEKYQLNTGVLQPLSNVVTSINEFGPVVFGNQIILGPNPTLGIVQFKASFITAGTVQLQLFDAKSHLVANHDLGAMAQLYNKEISLEPYSSGVYYLKVFFKSIHSNHKIGIYKIIKL